MNRMETSVMNRLETVDDTLRELCTSLEFMRVGAEGIANGAYLVDVMNHIIKSLQAARAELDEATGAVAQMRASA
ncbi:MAG: hypothetical protein Q4G52_09025 [Clostridia bacterium]|nr:hypothetical protein [Clostridia bacterium]